VDFKADDGLVFHSVSPEARISCVIFLFASVQTFIILVTSTK
jgi:hypothetical protein